MKLEPKHIIPYLDYRLKVQGQTNKEIQTLSGFRNPVIYTEESDSKYGWCDILDIKLILRPLSDLMKSTWINKFYIEFSGGYKSLTQYRYENLDNFIYSSYKSLPYQIVNKMFELHLDVFRLIPQGLAIDINTI